MSDSCSYCGQTSCPVFCVYLFFNPHNSPALLISQFYRLGAWHSQSWPPLWSYSFNAHEVGAESCYHGILEKSHTHYCCWGLSTFLWFNYYDSLTSMRDPQILPLDQTSPYFNSKNCDNILEVKELKGSWKIIYTIYVPKGINDVSVSPLRSGTMSNSLFFIQCLTEEQSWAPPRLSACVYWMKCL